MLKKTYTLILCSLILLSTMFVWVTPSSANPIALNMLEDGSALHNGTNIRMPHADVEINITRISDSVMVDLIGIYEFETNQTQNTTLAYVYPTLNFHSVQNANMTILVDSIETEFRIRTWNELTAFNFSDDLLQYTARGADFACFKVNLIANTTMILQVYSNAIFRLGSNDYWEYHYIFGSARTFEEDTWEKIHIRLVEQTPFISTFFFPDEYLDVTRNGKITDAIWEFNVSIIERNSITLHGKIKFPDSFYFWFAIIAPLVLVSIIVVIRIRRQRS